MTLMFQQEVAERIAAAPDTPGLRRLVVLAQWRAAAPADAPAAVRVHAAAQGVVGGGGPAAARGRGPADVFAAMERVTAAAFGQRRKMLRGSLRALGGEALLARAGIAPERRAETLDVAEFDRLARLLSGTPRTPSPWIANRAPRGCGSSGKRGRGGFAIEVT